jgi:hypothetical protein
MWGYIRRRRLRCLREHIEALELELGLVDEPNLYGPFTAALDSGTWASRLHATGAHKWKAAVSSKAANYSAGIAPTSQADA